MEDWRLQGQEKWLTGATFCWQTYKPRPNWDHDHCVFDSRRISAEPGERNEGYVTTDHRRHWVCKECFQDFAGMFKWKVVDCPDPSDASDS